MGQHIFGFDSLNIAKQKTLYSPAMAKVKFGVNSKTITGKSDWNDEMVVVGTGIADIRIQKKQTTPELVNLGLPSGTKWMKYNLGASTEEGYGLYYQWGETIGYPDASGPKRFSWSDYSLVVRSTPDLIRDTDKDKVIGGVTYHAFSNQTDTIYAFSSDYSFLFTYDEDNDQMISISNGGAMYDRYGIIGVYFVDETMTVLDANHDAVTAMYGSDYHIPTEEQIRELMNNTTHEIITDYKGVTGLNVMVFTSSINGAELVIPLSGVYSDGLNEHIGIQAGVISNELRSDSVNSFRYLLITIDNVTSMDDRHRMLGYTLRGVKDN